MSHNEEIRNSCFMHYLNGKEAIEIGHVTGVPERTISQWIQKFHWRAKREALRVKTEKEYLRRRAEEEGAQRFKIDGQQKQAVNLAFKKLTILIHKTDVGSLDSDAADEKFLDSVPAMGNDVIDGFSLLMTKLAVRGKKAQILKTAASGLKQLVELEREMWGIVDPDGEDALKKSKGDYKQTLDKLWENRGVVPFDKNFSRRAPKPQARKAE